MWNPGPWEQGFKERVDFCEKKQEQTFPFDHMWGYFKNGCWAPEVKTEIEKRKAERKQNNRDNTRFGDWGMHKWFDNQ